MTFTTIDGSSIFRVIIFEPFSTTIKAAPRLCACPMCLENFGSCDLFKTYEPIVHHLKKPALRSACLGFQKTNDDENTNIDDFFLPGSICVMASDNLDTESFWLLSIVSVNVAESDMMDDYHHVITKDQEYLECHYFEKQDKTRKGHVYRRDWKTAFIYKECIVYPFVNMEENIHNRYLLSNEEYCEILAYIEESGYSHL